jgi:hypothetical protein
MVSNSATTGLSRLYFVAISNGRSRAARGFRAGIGKTVLVVIIIVVVLGVLIGFSAARRFGRCR